MTENERNRIQEEIKQIVRCQKLGYIYKGETPEMLFVQLKEFGSVADKDDDIPLKPPCGIIHVGCDYKNEWIYKRKSFYGWNIHKYNDIPSGQIRTK